MKRFLAMLGAFLGGSAMVMQSRVNGELGSRIDSGFVAAPISFVGGLIILVIVAAVSPRTHRGIRSAIAGFRSGEIPWWYLSAGLVGAWYVMSQSVAVGLLGVAVFTVGGVAGQTISGLLVDRMGFGVLKPRGVTVGRVAGAIVAIVAVSLAVISGSEQIGSRVWLLILPFIGGCLQPFQQGMAGAIQRESRDPVTPTLANFLAGTTALAIVCAVAFAGGHRVEAFPTDWWVYAGGIFGAVFIGVGAVVVHELGTLLMGLLLIAGQVVTALFLDVVLPTAGSAVTLWSVASALLTLLAVVLSTLRRRRR